MYSNLIGKYVRVERLNRSGYNSDIEGVLISFNEFDLIIEDCDIEKNEKDVYILPIKYINGIFISKKEWKKNTKKVIKPKITKKSKPVKRKQTFFDLNFIEIMDITTKEERKNLTGDQRQHKENERLKFFGNWENLE